MGIESAGEVIPSIEEQIATLEKTLEFARTSYKLAQDIDDVDRIMYWGDDITEKEARLEKLRSSES